MSVDEMKALLTPEKIEDAEATINTYMKEINDAREHIVAGLKKDFAVCETFHCKIELFKTRHCWRSTGLRRG